MPAAIAIPLISTAASAGTALVGAKMASNSAKNAAKTQERSGQQAMDLNRQLYQQQEQRLSPFIAGGQQAMQSLGQLTSQPRPQMPTFNAFQPGGGWQNPAQMPQNQPKPGGGMVKMRTPTGQVVDVPADKVEQAKSMGGQLVGGL